MNDAFPRSNLFGSSSSKVVSVRQLIPHVVLVVLAVQPKDALRHRLLDPLSKLLVGYSLFIPLHPRGKRAWHHRDLRQQVTSMANYVNTRQQDR